MNTPWVDSYCQQHNIDYIINDSNFIRHIEPSHIQKNQTCHP